MNKRITILPDQPQFLCQIVYTECQHVCRRFLQNDPHNPEPRFAGQEEPGLCGGCKNRARCDPEHALYVPNISTGAAEAINAKIRAMNQEMLDQDSLTENNTCMSPTKRRRKMRTTSEIAPKPVLESPRASFDDPEITVLAKRIPDTDIANPLLQWLMNAKRPRGTDSWTRLWDDEGKPITFFRRFL